MAMLLRTGAGDAASYLAAPAEPDPPTGAIGIPTAPGGPLRGHAVHWTFAPIRIGGRVSLDTRWLRLEDGTRISQGVISNEIDVATYVWQPWFVQLSAGLGVLLARDQVQGRYLTKASSSSTGLTGRLGMSVFPASRFPFELRTDVADSRASGDTLGSDYRSHRLSLSQSYRPENRNDYYSVTYDRSRLSSERWGSDTVHAVNGTALSYLGNHALEFGAGFTRNERSDTGDGSRLASLRGRDSFQPAGSLHVDTLATWNDSRFRAGAFDFETDLRQLSSFATWRPREGEWLYLPRSPLYMTASARLLDGIVTSAGGTHRAQTINATLGVSQDVTHALRIAAAVAGTAVNVAGTDRSHSAFGNATATYTPEALPLGKWRYSPIVGATAGASRSSTAGQRYTLGGQFIHGLSRNAVWDDGQSLSCNITQSLAVLRESTTNEVTRAFAHSAGIYWQAASDGKRYRFVSLSVSDARNRDTVRGDFQLINLQVSQRLQVTRYSSWSGDLTVQESRSSTTLVDPFSGVLREQSPGWRHYYTGTLTYENQRAFDVPRLRLTMLLSASSQQFEQRILGDVDAPRERITSSIEGRFDYAIGRLESRLSARVARVDERTVSGVFVRVQRNY